MALWTEEERTSISTGKLRQRCETLANNDDETLELVNRGYDLRWQRTFTNPKLSLYKDGICTHGPNKGETLEDCDAKNPPLKF